MAEQWQNLTKKMGQISQFKDFDTEELLEIIRAGVIKRFSKGETIFHEGFECFGLCVLLKGEVTLYNLSPQGQDNIIAVIKPVIMFNEVAALDGGPNPVTAYASRNCLVWYVDYEGFQIGMKRFPQLVIGLLPVVARRMRKILKKYANLSFREVKDRMVILLLELSENGTIVIQRKNCTIKQMAAHIVTAPSVVSRILGALNSDGKIDCTRQEIKVLQPDEMAKSIYIELDP